MLLGECHERQHVGLGAVHESRKFGHSVAELIGDAAPLFACGVRVGLGKGGADPGRDKTAMTLACVGKNVAHEVDTGAVEKTALV
jgi:hypothetical protein